MEGRDGSDELFVGPMVGRWSVDCSRARQENRKTVQFRGASELIAAET